MVWVSFDLMVEYVDQFKDFKKLLLFIDASFGNLILSLKKYFLKSYTSKIALRAVFSY